MIQDKERTKKTVARINVRTGNTFKSDIEFAQQFYKLRQHCDIKAWTECKTGKVSFYYLSKMTKKEIYKNYCEKFQVPPLKRTCFYSAAPANFRIARLKHCFCDACRKGRLLLDKQRASMRAKSKEFTDFLLFEEHLLRGMVAMVTNGEHPLPNSLRDSSMPECSHCAARFSLSSDAEWLAGIETFIEHLFLTGNQLNHFSETLDSLKPGGHVLLYDFANEIKLHQHKNQTMADDSKGSTNVLGVVQYYRPTVSDLTGQQESLAESSDQKSGARDGLQNQQMPSASSASSASSSSSSRNRTSVRLHSSDRGNSRTSQRLEQSVPSISAAERKLPSEPAGRVASTTHDDTSLPPGVFVRYHLVFCDTSKHDSDLAMNSIEAVIRQIQARHGKITAIHSFSDNGSHFHNRFLTEYQRNATKSMAESLWFANYFAPGEGKSEADRLFGRVRSRIKRFLKAGNQLNGTVSEIIRCLSDLPNTDMYYIEKDEIVHHENVEYRGINGFYHFRIGKEDVNTRYASGIGKYEILQRESKILRGQQYLPPDEETDEETDEGIDGATDDEFSDSSHAMERINARIEKLEMKQQANKGKAVVRVNSSFTLSHTLLEHVANDAVTKKRKAPSALKDKPKKTKSVYSSVPRSWR